MSLIEQRSGALGQTPLEILDGDVELALENFDAAVEGGEAGLDRADDAFELALAGAELGTQNLHQLMPALLGLLEGEHREADCHISGILGNVGDGLGVDVGNIDLRKIDFWDVDFWEVDLGGLDLGELAQIELAEIDGREVGEFDGGHDGVSLSV